MVFKWFGRFRESLRSRLAFAAGWTIGWMLRCLFLTQRLKVVAFCEGVNPHNRNLDQRYLYCGWHEQLLFGGCAGRSYDLSAMVSQHRDGALVAGAFAAMGMAIVRGSSSRGGTQALRQAIEITRTLHMAITPDGPRGPRRELKEGVVYLASRAGVSIVPVACASNHTFLIRGSWTDMILPLPFGRTWMLYGDPIPVPPKIGREQLAEYAGLVQQAVEDLNEHAVELSGVAMPPLAEPAAGETEATATDDRSTRAA